MKKFSISVVIPNYNGKKLLEENLPFLYEALRMAETDYEVIISDDNSNDDSVEFITKNYPDIILIQSNTNCGFSPNINRGIRLAKKDLVFALNSDVVLTPDYFINQFKYFEKENTFGVMGRIIGIDNDEIQDGGKYPKKNLFKIKATTNYITTSPGEEWLPSLFLSGANALMDRKKLFTLEGYDEIYKPFYLEDVDLSLRAWRLGWASYYNHDSICRHPASSTILSHHKKIKVKIVSLRNRHLLHYIHLNDIDRLIWQLSIFIEFLFSWIVLKFYFYKSLFQFLKRIKQAKVSRNKINLLQKKYNQDESLTSIIKKIHKKVNSFQIQKF